jgi:hypothetical protein
MRTRFRLLALITALATVMGLAVVPVTAASAAAPPQPGYIVPSPSPNDHGITMTDACQVEYGGTGLHAATASSSDPYVWKCYRGSVLLGGLPHLDIYCSKKYQGGQIVLVPPHDAYSWKCRVQTSKHQTPGKTLVSWKMLGLPGPLPQCGPGVHGHCIAVSASCSAHLALIPVLSVTGIVLERVSPIAGTAVLVIDAATIGKFVKDCVTEPTVK